MIGVDSISYFKNGIVFPHVIYLMIKKKWLKKKEKKEWAKLSNIGSWPGKLHKRWKLPSSLFIRQNNPCLNEWLFYVQHVLCILFPGGACSSPFCGFIWCSLSNLEMSWNPGDPPWQDLLSEAGVKPISHSQRYAPGTLRHCPFSQRFMFSAHSSTSGG